MTSGHPQERSRDPARGADASLALGFAGVRVRAGEHVAHFYQSEGERWELLVAFLRAGLEGGDRCVHLPADGDRAVLERHLADVGVDVRRALDEGRLVFVERPDTVEGLRERLSAALEEAAAAAAGLRWSGNMTWARETLPDSRALMRWEAACNREWDGHRVVFFCQYDLSEFPGTVVMDALRSHPTCVIGRAVRQNSLYVDPGTFLERLDDRPATGFTGE